MVDDSPIPIAAVPEAAKALSEEVAAFVRTASLELTQPTPAEIERIAGIVPAGTEIFVSDVPRRSAENAVRVSAVITAAGLVPVPHIAVRRMDSVAALGRLVGDCVVRGGVRKAMLIAGDRDVPFGPLPDVATALEKCRLKSYGLREVSIAGYPEGHPRIPAERLAMALEEKLGLLEAQGIAARIITQFGFDDDAIARFVIDLRQRGIGCPLLIGVAGPTSAARLMQFTLRCGVRTAGRFLARDGRRIGGVLSGGHAERLIERLAGCVGEGRGGDLRAHVFAFGGSVPTAEWIRTLQDGRLRSG